MKICVLASGSRGNSIFIEAGQTKVLVDDGLNLHEIEKRLNLIGKNPSEISAIFLTHEHEDHICGVLKFCQKYGSKLFVHQNLVEEISSKLISVSDKIVLFSNADFFFGELTVSPFPVSHDSLYCVGFSFFHQGSKISISTDIGKITDAIIDRMKESEIVFIESNHDEKMLACGSYSPWLKKRISGNKGHISNDECSNAIADISKSGTRIFVLCHLSQHNNTAELAIETSRKKLTNNLIQIEVASQNSPSKIYKTKGNINE